MRAFLNAITEEEQAARRQEQDFANQIDQAKRQRSFLEWDQGQRVERLVGDLGLGDASLPDMPLLLDSLKSAAAEKLAAAAKLPSGVNAELDDARRTSRSARIALRDAELKAAELDAKFPLEEKLLMQMSSEIPGLSAAAQSAASPICPICEVPIDAALADGCKLSHKLPDQAQCRARWEAKRQEIDTQQQTIANIRAEIGALKPEIALARQKAQ